MSTLNVNKGIPESKLNAYQRPNNTDSVLQSAAYPLAVIAIALTVIWLTMIIVNGIWCAINPYDCLPQNVIILSLPALVLVAAIITAAHFIWSSIESNRNKAFIGMDEPRVHRNALLTQQPLTIEQLQAMLLKNYEGKGTSEMDTYSPSHSSTNTNNSADSTPIESEVDMNIIKWDKLFD